MNGISRFFVIFSISLSLLVGFALVPREALSRVVYYNNANYDASFYEYREGEYIILLINGLLYAFYAGSPEYDYYVGYYPNFPRYFYGYNNNYWGYVPFGSYNFYGYYNGYNYYRNHKYYNSRYDRYRNKNYWKNHKNYWRDNKNHWRNNKNHWKSNKNNWNKRYRQSNSPVYKYNKSHVNPKVYKKKNVYRSGTKAYRSGNVNRGTNRAFRQNNSTFRTNAYRGGQRGHVRSHPSFQRGSINRGGGHHRGGGRAAHRGGGGGGRHNR